MANTRVKVKRTVLIDRIQERIDEATKKHEAQVAEYEAKRDKFIADFPALVEKEAKRLAGLKPDAALEYFKRLRQNTYDGDTHLQVPILGQLPPQIDNNQYEYFDRRRGYRYSGFKGYVAELEKAKRVLESSEDETISVSASDFYADYL